MATINVNTFDTIEEWRLKSNELGVKVADLDNNLYTINVIASGNVTASGNINALGNVVVSRDAVVSGNIVGASNAIITGNVIAANVLANVHYGTYVTSKPAINVLFNANITGSANLLLSNSGTNILTISANVAADSVTLGAHTIGNYVKEITSADTANIIVNNGVGEGTTPTVNLAMTAVTPGVYGNANAVSTITVLRDGRITNAANLLIDRAYTLTTGKPSVNLNFTGDVTGKANLNLSAENTNSLDVALTVQTNSVALGADTTGNYVENLVQGSGITLTSATPIEGGTPTISANVTSVGSFVGAVSNTNLLASILQVDGAASLLDADLLDGQQGTYYLDWTNQTNKPAIDLTFTGDVTGTGGVVLTNSGTNTLSIALTSATNSVALGTDTTGNYTDRVVPGTGMTATGTTDEGNVITVGLASSGVTAAGYGNANVVSQITVDSTGRITSASNVAIDRRYATVTEKPSINLRFTGDATGNGNINISQTDKNELSINMIVATIGSGSLPETTVTPGTYGGGNTYAAFTVDSTGRLTAASNVALADTGVTAGSYGNANAVSQVTVDSKGRVTAASNLLIDRAYTLTTGKPSVNLAFTGDVTGSGSINLANENTNSLSIGLTIAADSIALGTDTTGNYTNRVVPGSCITVSGTADEGNVITINHSDTSTITGTQGGSGIAGITIDDFGHVTGVTTATYCSAAYPAAPEFKQTGNTIFSCTQTTLASLTATEFNFIVGPNAGCALAGGCHNVFMGSAAGRNTTSGQNNIVVGRSAGLCINTGQGNNFFGLNAGRYTECGSHNFFAGSCAGWSTNTGSNNIFLGRDTGALNTAGNCNIFLGGCRAGLCNTTGCRNIYFGSFAGGNVTTGNDNIIFGCLSSCVGLTGSTSNVIIMATGGIQSFNIDSVYCNFVVGRYSGTKLSTGSFNFIAGFCSGTCITSANHNFFAGRCAGSNATSSDNIMIGDCAGRNVTAQSRNIFIGSSSAGCSVACATGGTDNVGIGPFTLRDFSCGCLNSAVGYGAGLRNNTGSCNTYLGSFTGCDITSGSRNLFAGFRGNITTGNDNIIFGCLSSCVGLSDATSNVILMSTGGGDETRLFLDGSCKYNVYIGQKTGKYTTEGRNNVFLGRCAGFCNTGGHCNVYIGQRAGFCNLTGCNNIFIGGCAGFCNRAGHFNVFLGEKAGVSNVTGCYNTFIGNYAGFNNISGGFNIFLGHLAGIGHQTGNNNIFLGSNAGRYSTSSAFNILIGNLAGCCITTGCYNVFQGNQAGQRNTTGSENVFIGKNSGACNTIGCNNIFIGRDAGFGASGLVNNTTACNRIVLGNTAHTLSCINTAWTTPSDIRDKCIFGPVPHGKSFLNNINPITFSFKNRETNELKDNRKRYGFSAQEVLAAEGKDPVIVGAENPDKLGFTSDFIIPILVNAVKELTKDVEELRAEIAELKKSR